MVDKIPWDTWVIAWIICAFKTEFEKALLFFLKFVSAPPPSTPYYVETLEKCPTLYGEAGGGAEQV